MAGALYAVLTLALLIGGVLWYCLAMPGRSHNGPLPPATVEESDLAARLKRHVIAIASAPHNIQQEFANLEAAARYIEGTLAAEGYTVNAQRYDVDDHTVRNIEVVIEPAAGSADVQTIVVGAHYDSAFGTPGANDNGSGCAAVIELARLLKGSRPAHTRLRLVLFVNEEPPYFQTENMGSYRYAKMLAERGERVAGMISLETIGHFTDAAGSQKYPPLLSFALPDRGNFVAFVGMPASRGFLREVVASFRQHTAFPSVGGVAPGFLPGIDWSDHWSFAQFDMPALMVTDTAPFRYEHYHRPSDTPGKVNYEHLARITKGMERVLRDLAKLGVNAGHNP